MDARKLDSPVAVLDVFKRYLCVTIQSRGINSIAIRQVRAEFIQSLAKLPRSARRVAPLLVIEPDRQVNQRLQKQAARTLLLCPGFFEDLMTLEELVAIEKLDTRPQWFYRDVAHVSSR